MEYALSTNSDIYLYDLGSKKTTNLSEGMMGDTVLHRSILLMEKDRLAKYGT